MLKCINVEYEVVHREIIVAIHKWFSSIRVRESQLSLPPPLLSLLYAVCCRYNTCYNIRYSKLRICRLIFRIQSVWISKQPFRSINMCFYGNPYRFCYTSIYYLLGEINTTKVCPYFSKLGDFTWLGRYLSKTNIVWILSTLEVAHFDPKYNFLLYLKSRPFRCYEYESFVSSISCISNLCILNVVILWNMCKWDFLFNQ